METEEESVKPDMFVRKGRSGGLYFFSPKGTVIYYMNGEHVRAVLDGKKEFAVITKGEKK